MEIPTLSELDLSHWEAWVVPTIGVLSASLTLFTGFLFVRRSRAGRVPETTPDETHDPFDQGSVTDRRVASRRTGNQVEILVTDAELKGEPIRGWVIDRSLGGLCLFLSEELAQGTILAIKPRQHPPGTPWVQVTVRNCTRDKAGYEIGCQFVRIPPWAVLLLFG